MDGVVGAFRTLPRRHPLQRMFPTFPGGWPGIGLLLLRAVLGATLSVEGAAYVSDWRHLGILTGTICMLAIASGVLLLIGYLTPLAGAVAALTGIGSALSWFPASNPNLFDTRFSAALAIVMALAIMCLGPGAFSLDARLFGRREIIIPSGPPSPKP
jgi:uncharacterized membrane protein YphA (DoxX/SURF4 family)